MLYDENILIKLKQIADWLESRFNQETITVDQYVIQPNVEVLKYDEHTAISLWECGAIVCIGSILYFVGEDDGNWFVCNDDDFVGFQSAFCIGWTSSFIAALERLEKYVNDHGTPIYWSGNPEKGICHYKL